MFNDKTIDAYNITTILFNDIINYKEQTIRIGNLENGSNDCV
jgi:hypothetical protein